MKRPISVLLLLLLFLTSLTGCVKSNEAPDKGASPEAPPDITPIVSRRFEVVSYTDGALLLVSDDPDGFYLLSHFLDITQSGDPIDLYPSPGDVLDIGYEGSFPDIPPASDPDAPLALPEPLSIVYAGRTESLVDLYRQVTAELWQADDALNSGAQILAMDVSSLLNLTPAEMRALRWLCAQDCGAAPLDASSVDLAADGYITEDGTRFPDGVLIRFDAAFDDGDISASRFTFSVIKWRSALGAVGFSDCQAERSGSGWSYTVGGMFIS